MSKPLLVPSLVVFLGACQAAPAAPVALSDGDVRALLAKDPDAKLVLTSFAARGCALAIADTTIASSPEPDSTEGVAAIKRDCTDDKGRVIGGSLLLAVFDRGAGLSYVTGLAGTVTYDAAGAVATADVIGLEVVAGSVHEVSYPDWFQALGGVDTAALQRVLGDPPQSKPTVVAAAPLGGEVPLACRECMSRQATIWTYISTVCTLAKQGVWYMDTLCAGEWDVQALTILKKSPAIQSQAAYGRCYDGYFGADGTDNFAQPCLAYPCPVGDCPILHDTPAICVDAQAGPSTVGICCYNYSYPNDGPIECPTKHDPE